MVADGGSQFDSKEFEKFASEWEFSVSLTDPYHSQSNGKAESAVKIAKRLLRKSADSNQDVHKAVLDWRNTPTAGIGSSPAQRLMARRTKTLLPTSEALLQPVIPTQVEERITEKKQKIQRQYDKTAKELPALNVGEVVRMKPPPGDLSREWKRGRCIKKLGERSYIVDVGGRAFQRNRKFIKATTEQSEEKSDSSSFEPSDEQSSELKTTIPVMETTAANIMANATQGQLGSNFTSDGDKRDARLPQVPATRPKRQINKPARYADFVP